MSSHRFLPLLAGLTLLTSTALAQPQGSLFTANERDASLSEVRLATGQVNTHALAIAPHNVQVSPDGRLLLAVGMPAHAEHAGHDGAAGQLLVFASDALSRPLFSLPAGAHPAHVVTDGEGRRAFVTDSGTDRVRVFDLQERREIASVATGRYPHGLRLSPDGRSLYVANMRSDSVSVIALDSLRETARIEVGKAPVQVGFTPDGRLALVSLSAENRLGLIDTASHQLLARVAVGRTPIQMMAGADGRFAYVANQGSAQQPDDRLSVVDLQRRETVTTLTTGKGAHGVAISTDGAYIFVTNIEDGSVSVVDTATREVIARHLVGAGPNGITYMAGGSD